MKRFLLSISVLVAPLHAQAPSAMATEARVWLKVAPEHPPLTRVVVSIGSSEPASWEADELARKRTTDIRFPIRWWSWQEAELRFTPAHDGEVDLYLHGPWSPEVDGVMPRKEVLWDDVSAEGTDMENGGFETSSDGVPTGWKSPWAAYPAADAWPFAQGGAKQGERMAASWCKRPLVRSLSVRSGREVVIRLHARAATPPGFVEPGRLSGKTAAHRALAPLKRGVNFGNGWEAPPPDYWGIRFTPEDVDHAADEGFDHLRIPVAWHFHLREQDGGPRIDPALLKDLEPVLRRAMDRGLRVFLNWHHFHDFTTDPQANLERFTSGWDAIARHFRDWPPGLFFELLNEPCDALSTEVANPIYQKTIRLIRRSNPQRLIVVSPGHWGIIGELGNLRLPDDDDNLAVTVHCYEPFHFTHQGAGWVGLQSLKGVHYPGPPPSPMKLPDDLLGHAGVRTFVDRYNAESSATNPSSAAAIRILFDEARAWSEHFGRPVHLGEFGAYQAADHASRARYLRDVRILAEERGIPWTLWEWKAGFGYWDAHAGRPRFRASLME